MLEKYFRIAQYSQSLTLCKDVFLLNLYSYGEFGLVTALAARFGL